MDLTTRFLGLIFPRRPSFRIYKLRFLAIQSIMKSAANQARLMPNFLMVHICDSFAVWISGLLPPKLILLVFTDRRKNVDFLMTNFSKIKSPKFLGEIASKLYPIKALSHQCSMLYHLSMPRRPGRDTNWTLVRSHRSPSSAFLHRWISSSSTFLSLSPVHCFCLPGVVLAWLFYSP